jgi:double-strand break repair protein MRE11
MSPTPSTPDTRSNDPSIFRILVTNDNHVGYKEDDKVRSRDALSTFEAIFTIARSHDVDFVLHSGDLFDDCRPNRFWVNSVCDIFKRYCLGDGEVRFEHLHNENSKPSNFEDPNMNIDMPVYMIHGNHDDLGGEFGDNRPLSCADLLDTVNLVNYFGKQENVEESIEVRPILFKKGDARLALYGLGNIRDDRLYRLFQGKKISFLAPPAEDNFFSIMSIHQNRYKGASGGAPAKNCVHPTFLPSFLNLVVWAHEHECIPSIEQSVEGGFHILQSGSSVATSLTVGEQAQKNVFLIEINQENLFRVTPIPLHSVRPMVIDEIVFPSNVSLGSPEGEKILAQKVQTMVIKGGELARTSREFFDKSMKFQTVSPELPLVRLKVLVTPSAHSPPLPNGHIMNQKFGRQFLNQVANPDEILQLVVPNKQAARRRQSGVVQLEIEDTVLSTSTAGQSQEKLVQDLIFNYMTGTASNSLLDVLVEPDFNVAVQDFVHKNDLLAIERFLKLQIDEIAKLSVNDAGIVEIGSIHEIAKQRATTLRAERLATAIAGSEAPAAVNEAPSDDEDLLMFVNDDSTDMNNTTIVGDSAPVSKRARSDSGSSSEFSDGLVFGNARDPPPKVAAAKPKRKSAKKTTADKNPPQSGLAAFLSQQATSSAAPPATRQWARRM